MNCGVEDGKEIFWLQKIAYGDEKNGGNLRSKIAILQNYIESLEPKFNKNNEVLKNISYMNLNKRGGEKSACPNTISSYSKKYREFIKKEIELLSPDLVICGGTYQYLKENIYENNVEELSKDIFKINYNKKQIYFIGMPHLSSRTSYKKYLANFINKYKIIIED